MTICGEKTVVLSERRRGKIPSFAAEKPMGFWGGGGGGGENYAVVMRTSGINDKYKRGK